MFMVTRNDSFSCNVQLGTLFQYMILRAMFHFARIRDPIGQPTWDPYETGGQKLYGALKGRNMGKIWGKYGQDLGPILATHMRPILHIGNPHGTHMKHVDKNCLGPIWTELWAIMWTLCAGSGTHMGSPHGTHMKQVDKKRMALIWVAHICVAHVCVLAGFISKSFFK